MKNPFKQKLVENKKFFDILDFVKKFLYEAKFKIPAVAIENKMLPKSAPKYSFIEITGKAYEVFVKDALEANTLEESRKNNLKYFFIIKPEPLGLNEFPDFVLGVGLTKKPTKENIFWFYIENKTYSGRNYNFGTSSLDALIDNITTKIGEPTRLEGKLKRIDKITTPVIIEKFSESFRCDQYSQLELSEIEIFQMYEVLNFNSLGSFTTKNKDKNLMVSPASSADCTICGSVEEWLHGLKETLEQDEVEPLLMRTIRCLDYTKQEVIEKIKDRLLNPILYQGMRNLIMNDNENIIAKNLF